MLETKKQLPSQSIDKRLYFRKETLGDMFHLKLIRPLPSSVLAVELDVLSLRPHLRLLQPDPVTLLQRLAPGLLHPVPERQPRSRIRDGMSPKIFEPEPSLSFQ